MDRIENFRAAEGGNNPFDLAPVAKAHQVAAVSAVTRTRSSLPLSQLAEGMHQLRGIVERGPVFDE